MPIEQLMEWATDPSLLAGAALWWAVSAAIGGMPTPPENASYGLRWLYNSMQLLGANLYRLADAAGKPASRTFKFPMERR